MSKATLSAEEKAIAAIKAATGETKGTMYLKYWLVKAESGMDYGTDKEGNPFVVYGVLLNRPLPNKGVSPNDVLNSWGLNAREIADKLVSTGFATFRFLGKTPMLQTPQGYNAWRATQGLSDRKAKDFADIF